MRTTTWAGRSANRSLLSREPCRKPTLRGVVHHNQVQFVQIAYLQVPVPALSSVMREYMIMLDLDRQAATSLARLLPRLSARLLPEADPALLQQFSARLERHFAQLFSALVHLYGHHYDFFYHLEEVLISAAQAWLSRPEDLRALDARRESDPRWFQSQEMIGAVCYVDLFAGGLRGLEARIPYLQELGVTYLHLMPLFEAPQGNSDGGYAVSSYRDVNPALAPGCIPSFVNASASCLARL